MLRRSGDAPLRPTPLRRRSLAQRWSRLLGSCCRIRPLTAADTDQILRHFAELSPQGRADRFNASVSTATMETRYRSIDWRQNRLYGARFFGKLVAIAEIAQIPGDGTPSCELALSVLDGWQGAHLGQRLATIARDQVCQKDHQSLVVYSRSDNFRLIRLVKKLGAVGMVGGGGYSCQFPPC